MFNLNSTFLFLVSGTFILFVIVQSLFFLVRAYRQAISIGIDRKVLVNVMKSSALFTIAPAISILLGVISLSKFLGLPFPWLRLSILGAITYELSAAASAASSMGIEISNAITDANVFVTIAWVMTLGIIPSMLLIPLFLKKIQGGIDKFKNRDKVWGSYFMDAIFLGMISAFLGVVFKDVSKGLTGFIPIFVMMFSMVIMAVIGLIINRYKFNKLRDYALPISMLSAMGFAIFITAVIGG
jgi:hypothetical protein